MKARSIWSHGWRCFVDWLMMRTYGYEHADMNRWRDRIHELQGAPRPTSPRKDTDDAGR